MNRVTAKIEAVSLAPTIPKVTKTTVDSVTSSGGRGAEQLLSTSSRSRAGNDGSCGGGGDDDSEAGTGDCTTPGKPAVVVAPGRCPSPNPADYGSTFLGVGFSAQTMRGSRNNLQIPSEHYGYLGSTAGGGGRIICKGILAGLAETLFEEESDLIRSCGALSTVLGLRKSFSTSDITSSAAAAAAGPASDFYGGDGGSGGDFLRASASEVVLSTSAGAAGGQQLRDDLTSLLQGGGRLDYASRSCSTWVAVGDMASASQLPSPQGNGGPPGHLSDGAPVITAAEFVRSVNKKVRQTYIKRRLLTTYKALERIAQSELNLQQAVAAAASSSAAAASPTPATGKCGADSPSPTSMSLMAGSGTKVSKTQVSREILKLLKKDFDPHGPGLLGAAKNLSLTAKDVEREKGKPLTKYERNIMIFNWLHTLEDTTYDRMN